MRPHSRIVTCLGRCVVLSAAALARQGVRARVRVLALPVRGLLVALAGRRGHRGAAGLLDYASRMNVSPHQQRPTKYPWPGNQPVLGVVLVVVLVLVIGFIVVNWTDDNGEPDAASAPDTAALLITT